MPDSRDDIITLRGAGPHRIDALANDDLAPATYRFSTKVAAGKGTVGFLSRTERALLSYQPTEGPKPSYLDLAVGKEETVIITYTVDDPLDDKDAYTATVTVTLEGWAQIGGNDADSLTGSDEADHLSGGPGAPNLLTGLGGDDWYTVQLVGDLVIEAADAGNDRIRTNLPSYVLPDNVEQLAYFGTTNFTGTGNALDNRLIGGAGDDTLSGGDGDDILSSGAGTDILIGGAGDDSYIAAQADLIFEDQGGGFDTVFSTGSFQLYANVERLILPSGESDAFGVGNELGNVITGNDGQNLLIGLDGDDTLNGNGGADALFGLDGSDVLKGGDGIDYLVGGNGNDGVDGGNDADALYGEDGDDRLTGGDSFDTDILVGGAGNDYLDGASGLGDYDLMDGGAGNDIYVADTPADLTFETADGGIDTVYADIVGAGYYLYAHVENLVLEGSTPFGVGNEMANQLTGSDQGNWLLGGAGNDTLNGGAGNDVLFGEAGSDTFVFQRGTGGDVIGDFAPGTDKINLRQFFKTFAEVQAALVEVAGTSALILGNGDLIVLNGVAKAALTAADFILG